MNSSFLSNLTVGGDVLKEYHMMQDATDQQFYYYGRIAGNGLTTIVGAGEWVLGTTGTLGGGALSLTGVGATVGVPAIAASVALFGHGSLTINNSMMNMAADIDNASNSAHNRKAS